MKGKILWLAPGFYIQNMDYVMTTWRKYFEEYTEWSITTNKEDVFDIVFFGSDSELDEELLNDDSIFKLLYFHGYPWFRLIPVKENAWWIEHYRKVLNLVRKCDMVLTNSIMTFYQLCDFGISSQVCYLGVDNRLIDSVPEQEKEEQICACARLVPHKSCNVLIKAVSKLNRKIKVVIIGGGKEKERLVDLAKKLSVELEIKILNHYDKIKEFKKSLCVVAPSIYESFGLVPVEALCAGVPVIVVDMPISREVLKGDAVYFSNENDLVKILEDMIANPMPNKVHFVKSFYTLDNACKRLNIVFKAVIEKQKEK